jgi:GGDEF domain-containing protein
MKSSKKSQAFLPNVVKQGKTAFFGVGLVVLLAVLNQSNPGYIDIPFHPYLILFTVLGCLFGLRRTVLMTIPATGFYLYFLYHYVDHEAVETWLTFEAMTMPLLFNVLPATIGVLTDHIRNEMFELKERLSEQEKITKNLETVHTSVSEEKKMIENRFASQVKSSSHIFDYAQILESNDVHEISQAIADLACDQLLEDNCYVYTLEGEAYKLNGQQGPASEEIPDFIPLKEISKYPLIEKAVQYKSLARSEEHDDKSLEHGIVAPLIGYSEKVVGLLIIRTLHFFNYTPSTFSIVNSIASWGGMCVSRSIYLRSVWEGAYRDGVTGMFSEAYFKKRIQAEFEQAKKYSLPLYMVRFYIPGVNKLPITNRNSILKLLSECVSEPTRAVDDTTVGSRIGEFNTIIAIASQPEVDQYKENVIKKFEELKTRIDSESLQEIEVSQCTMNRDVQNVLDDFLESEKKWAPPS